MAETTEQKAAGRRKEVVGEVVSNKMNKTIVVEVTRKKSPQSRVKDFGSHPFAKCRRKDGAPTEVAGSGEELWQ